jgi:hypothetical protein
MKNNTITRDPDSKVWNNMIERWNTHKNDRTLEKMFMESNSGQERKNVKAYAKLFEL